MKKQKIIISWRFLKKDGQYGVWHRKVARMKNYVFPLLKVVANSDCVGELRVNYGRGKKNEAPFKNKNELRLALGAFLEKNNIDLITGGVN
jgi:hypothetical protein